MKLIAALLLFSLSVSGQQSTGAAETKGMCSPANTGNNNTFNITCGIGKQQGDALLKILNKILADQLDPDAVMTKLEEILHAVNPNLPARTYFCDGHWKIVGPSANAALDISMGGDDTAFQEMIRLNHTGYYADLLQSCQAQIRSAPEWLTPRLFCSLAYLGTGDMANAKTMLREFDSRTGPAYDAGACKQMSDYLHQRLP